jgi:hypothetical protein
MKPEREYWVETVSRTYLYYKVKARSKREALEKYQNGVEEYIGCNDSPDQRARAVLARRPQVSWR